MSELIMTKEECDLTVNRIYRCFDGFNWEDAETYRKWIAQTYYYVRRATRMIAFAAAHTPIEEEELHLKLLVEISEEKGHEKLLENDMKAMRGSLSDYPELPETSFFYETLIYLIQHKDPISILGYLIPLEGAGCLYTHEFYKRAAKAHGEKAASFLKIHSKLDIEHYAQCLKIVETLNGGSKIPIVRMALAHCTSVYENLIRAMLKAQPRKLRTDRAIETGV